MKSEKKEEPRKKTVVFLNTPFVLEWGFQYYFETTEFYFSTKIIYGKEHAPCHSGGCYWKEVKNILMPFAISITDVGKRKCVWLCVELYRKDFKQLYFSSEGDRKLKPGNW
jgi:hypothetical protein